MEGSADQQLCFLQHTVPGRNQAVALPWTWAPGHLHCSGRWRLCRLARARHDAKQDLQQGSKCGLGSFLERSELFSLHSTHDVDTTQHVGAWPSLTAVLWRRQKRAAATFLSLVRTAASSSARVLVLPPHCCAARDKRQPSPRRPFCGAGIANTQIHARALAGLATAVPQLCSPLPKLRFAQHCSASGERVWGRSCGAGVFSNNEGMLNAVGKLAGKLPSRRALPRARRCCRCRLTWRQSPCRQHCERLAHTQVPPLKFLKWHAHPMQCNGCRTRCAAGR